MNSSLVLCYHAVSSSWSGTLAVSPRALQGQLELALRRGYEAMTFSELVAGGGAGRTLAVTFDDAYRSVHDLARPVLHRLGIPATVFAPTDFVGRDAPMSWPGIEHHAAGRHARELRPMSWEQLGALQAEGWEVGSHTASHPHLTRLADDQLDAEMLRSRRMLEQRLGRPCRSIAYPYGDADARVARAAERAGYLAGADLGPAAGERGPLLWPRIGVYPQDRRWRYAVKLSPTLRRVHAGLRPPRRP